MKNPIRTPDFSKIYPSEKAFRTAIANKKATAEKMLKHAERTEGAQDDRFPDDLEREGGRPIDPNLLRSFGPRRFGHELLRSAGTKIVPAASGRIEEMLITIPWYKGDNGIEIFPRNIRHYRSLISALGNNRTYTILCHPDSEEEVDSWFSGLENVVRNYCLSPVFDYSIWAQDAYVALQSDDDQSLLVEGISFNRNEDMTIADDVAAQSNTGILDSDLYFEGGNILGGRDYCLIGEDYIHHNETRFGFETREKVIRAFEQVLGREIIALGGTRSASYALLDDKVFTGFGFQPLFHIDMFVTPTGVVAEDGREIVFLGRPRKAHETTGRYSEEDTYNNIMLDDFFHEIEGQLLVNFDVRDLPLMLTYGHLNHEEDDAKYYWLTFNNVVLENSGEEKNVIMTTYSQDSVEYGTNGGLRRVLEAEAERLWESIGFTVHRTDGMEELAYGDGSIHCITKTLKRSGVADGESLKLA